jgi:WD40 repeat protein
VNHLKQVSDSLLVVSCTDGTLQLADIRFLSQEPIFSFAGLINRHQRDLALEVYSDEILAAAGQDGFINIWSLRTGEKATSTHGLASQRFPDAVKAMAFDPRASHPTLHIASGPRISQFSCT